MVQATQVTDLGINEAGELFRTLALSPVELVTALIERTASVQEQLVPYITLTPEIALEQARRAESAFLQGEAALAPLRALDLRAIRLVEPAVAFKAAWSE